MPARAPYFLAIATNCRGRRACLAATAPRQKVRKEKRGKGEVDLRVRLLCKPSSLSDPSTDVSLRNERSELSGAHERGRLSGIERRRAI